MIFEPLTSHVPYFPRCCPYTGKRGRKRYKNQHTKSQRLFNKVGFIAYYELLKMQRDSANAKPLGNSHKDEKK